MAKHTTFSPCLKNIKGGIPGTRIDQINTIPCPIRVTSPALYNYDSEDGDLANSTLYDDDEGGIEHKPVDLSSLPSTGFEDEGAVAQTPDAKPSKDLMKYYQRIAFNCLWNTQCRVILN